MATDHPELFFTVEQRSVVAADLRTMINSGFSYPDKPRSGPGQLCRCPPNTPKCVTATGGRRRRVLVVLLSEQRFTDSFGIQALYGLPTLCERRARD